MEKTLEKKPIFTKEEYEEILRYKELFRNLMVYLSYFNITLLDLKKKKILDIGSGAANFAKDARKYGVNVISIDPIYSLEEGRKIFKKEPLFSKLARFLTGKEKDLPLAVAGIGQKLPFKGESFDMITLVYSSLYYSKTKDDIKNNITEALRVLKKGGEILLFPLIIKDGHPQLENIIDPQNANKYFQEIVSTLEIEGKIEKFVGCPKITPHVRIFNQEMIEMQRYMRIVKK